MRNVCHHGGNDTYDSVEEIEECITRQRNGKAAGPNGVPFELLKNRGEVEIDKMTKLFKQVREEECRETEIIAVTLLREGGQKSKQELNNYNQPSLYTQWEVFSAGLNERLSCM